MTCGWASISVSCTAFARCAVAVIGRLHDGAGVVGVDGKPVVAVVAIARLPTIVR